MDEELVNLEQEAAEDAELFAKLKRNSGAKLRRTINDVPVSSEKAVQYLKRNVDNRPVSYERVERYKRSLRAGEWKGTHEGIAFSPEGDLVDGQHRLLAIVETGITAPLDITFNQPKDTVPLIGIGGMRSGSDLIATYHPTASPTDIAAGLGWLHALTRGYVWPRRKARASNAVRASMYDAIPEFDGICKNLLTGSPRGILPRGHQAALTYMFSKTRPQQEIEHFWRAVLRGEDIDEERDGALVAVRKNLLYWRNWKKEQRLAVVILAWNDWVRGKAKRNYSFELNTEKHSTFPVVAGWPSPLLKEE